ncbi:MAG: hypothetical protein ACI82I_002102 [Gammaproteobacteria bacterium]|jgi:uncharacterized protein (UPF0261 family)
MKTRILLLATVETKANEIGYLADALIRHGLTPEICDISLRSNGSIWSPAEKLRKMELTAQKTLADILQNLDGTVAVIGLGGGTGGEVILRILRDLPLRFPKLLVTTLPFDPRAAVADNAITIIPTLADIAGLNASLRLILDNTAAMVAGLAASPSADIMADRSAIGITALGVTQGACHHLLTGLQADGRETIVFHANGYGGAAFSRFAREGAFEAIIDMTVHEITRMEIAGVHAEMPDRFTCARHIPRVVLPGGINFLGLGELRQISDTHLARPHYQHSGFFTHVQISTEEAKSVTKILCDHLNTCTGHVEVLLPMGGFSSEDRTGGALENPALREVVAQVFEANADTFTVTRIPSHINAPETATAAIEALRPHLKDLE